MGLQIVARKASEVTILDLQGRVTIGKGNDALATGLREAMEGGCKKLLVNLRGVNQIDSSGISTIVRAFVTLTRAGGGLKLLNATGRVHEVLEVTRLLASIPHFTAEPEALKSFQ
jgi:anti-sigma B factor antagonist